MGVDRIDSHLSCIGYRIILIPMLKRFFDKDNEYNIMLSLFRYILRFKKTDIVLSFTLTQN